MSRISSEQRKTLVSFAAGHIERIYLEEGSILGNNSPLNGLFDPFSVAELSPEMLALGNTEFGYNKSVKEKIANSLEDDQPLSKETKLWLVSFLRDQIPSPRKKPGPNFAARDLALCSAVYEIVLITKGVVHATRSEASNHTDSGCEIVLDAAKKLKIKVPRYEQMEDIWIEFKRVLEREWDL